MAQANVHLITGGLFAAWVPSVSPKTLTWWAFHPAVTITEFVLDRTVVLAEPGCKLNSVCTPGPWKAWRTVRLQEDEQLSWAAEITVTSPSCLGWKTGERSMAWRSYSITHHLKLLNSIQCFLLARMGTAIFKFWNYWKGFEDSRCKAPIILLAA